LDGRGKGLFLFGLFFDVSQKAFSQLQWRKRRKLQQDVFSAWPRFLFEESLANATFSVVVVVVVVVGADLVVLCLQHSAEKKERNKQTNKQSKQTSKKERNKSVAGSFLLLWSLIVISCPATVWSRWKGIHHPRIESQGRLFQQKQTETENKFWREQEGESS
jgi:hypothetical protein